jgi:hypothetical protein
MAGRIDEPPVLIEPPHQRPQRCGGQPISSLARHAPRRNQTRPTQTTQMVRDRLLRHRKRFGELLDRTLVRREAVEDRSPRRIGNRPVDGVHGVQLYKQTLVSQYRMLPNSARAPGGRAHG